MGRRATSRPVGHQNNRPNPNRGNSFSMTYGAEAMSPVEIGLPSPRRLLFNDQANNESMSSLDLLSEKRDDSQTRLASYQRKMARYFNKKVKKKPSASGTSF
ncbi:Rve domain-containing protein [Abeliophyllum distichum]|uniref:Rve domain-containing protein n=1 Tax=Abeliophyllum distichum TaxID=126358 RepID=A0ABD1NQ43_9LAMI